MRGSPTGTQPDCDRRTPEWAKPLAPLPEWLASVEALCREPRRRVLRHEPREAARPGSEIARARRLWYRAQAMCVWRENLGLSPSRAARLLGYDGASAIRAIEEGIWVRRDVARQQRLVARRCPGALVSRTRWLQRWRVRLDLSQHQAADWLGYASRMQICMIEAGYRDPSWERVLVAIEIEQASRCNEAPRRIWDSLWRARPEPSWSRARGAVLGGASS